MNRPSAWLLLIFVTACAGTETGNPPAEPIVEPFEGGEPDLEHTSYFVNIDVATRGYSFGVRFSADALPADTLSVTGTVLTPDAQPESFVFEGEYLTVGFNQASPVVVRIQPIGSEGPYASSDLLIAQDGTIVAHSPRPACLSLSRKDLNFHPNDVLEPIAVEFQNDCESEQVIDWSVLGDPSLLDVLSASPLRIDSGGHASLEVFPAKDEAGSLTILLDPGGGLEQRRAISVRLLSP